MDCFFRREGSTVFFYSTSARKIAAIWGGSLRAVLVADINNGD